MRAFEKCQQLLDRAGDVSCPQLTCCSRSNLCVVVPLQVNHQLIRGGTVQVGQCAGRDPPAFELSVPCDVIDNLQGAGSGSGGLDGQVNDSGLLVFAESIED